MYTVVILFIFLPFVIYRKHLQILDTHGIDDKYTQVPEAEAYRLVCRQGHNFTGRPNISTNNKCLYLLDLNPYLLLNPFKIEVLMWNPIRMICHDLFDNIEIKWIIAKYNKMSVFLSLTFQIL